MTTPKRIIGLSVSQIGITKAEFSSLQTIAAVHQGKAWDTTSNSPLKPLEKTLVKNFKNKLKENLFIRFQHSFCCYCAIELTNHKRTYDLEHIIAKDGRCNVVFALENLALSCAACNGHKFTKKITTSAELDPNSVPTSSVDYIIVHPHHDEWSVYFEVDHYGRVVPKYSPYLKARKTIEICGIEKQNAFRLARRFDWVTSSLKRHSDWINFYQDLYAPIDPARGKKLAKFAKTLLESQGDPAAANLYALLKDRIDVIAAAVP